MFTQLVRDGRSIWEGILHSSLVHLQAVTPCKQHHLFSHAKLIMIIQSGKNLIISTKIRKYNFRTDPLSDRAASFKLCENRTNPLLQWTQDRPGQAECWISLKSGRMFRLLGFCCHRGGGEHARHQHGAVVRPLRAAACRVCAKTGQCK